jgi:predicted nuclease with TOPRIM domain
MSDTPRTDEAQFGTGRVSVSFAAQLERELNAANVEIEEKRKDIVYLATEKAKLEERIKRLEEAGDWMRHHSNNDWWCEKWDETKEAKP